MQIWSRPKWTQVNASVRRLTQAHASHGQTEKQVDASFELASTCVAVWSGLKVLIFTGHIHWSLNKSVLGLLIKCCCLVRFACKEDCHTCKLMTDSRVFVPCPLLSLLILVVCFLKLLLFSRASLEFVWPSHRCTIVMTPLKAASHWPFHKTPVKGKKIENSHLLWFCITTISDHPIRSETKTNCDFRTRFPALHTGYMNVLQVVIGSIDLRVPVGPKFTVSFWQTVQLSLTRPESSLMWKLQDAKDDGTLCVQQSTQDGLKGRLGTSQQLFYFRSVASQRCGELENGKDRSARFARIKPKMSILQRSVPVDPTGRSRKAPLVLQHSTALSDQNFIMKRKMPHRYIMNVLLKSVRVFRTKFLKTQVQVVVLFM